MHLRVVNFVLARLVLASMAVLCVPLLLALLWGEESARAFALSIGLSLAVWALLVSHARA